ncbi:MAG: carboxymuconolactone decarboxylase family protein [Candidatus Competibacteraceae bacterium]
MSHEKLAALTQTRQWAHRKLLDQGSKVYQAFLQMEGAAFADGALTRKTKELIAIGISVRIDCESCMQWHIEQAAKAGANWREILEAVEVGIEMGGGPATVSARFALTVMEELFPDCARDRAASSTNAE